VLKAAGPAVDDADKARGRGEGTARPLTPGGTMPWTQIKDEKTYRKLRDRGESKEKSARIANAAAAASRDQVGREGGQSGSCDDWSKQDLVWWAGEIGIKGRSTMSKAQLIKAPAAGRGPGRSGGAVDNRRA
jgi:hypothetical protein